MKARTYRKIVKDFCTVWAFTPEEVDQILHGYQWIPRHAAALRRLLDQFIADQMEYALGRYCK